MNFVLLLAFLFMWLANPITGFDGFDNPEKWMKRAIRKLQRKTSAYGNMIASNTDEISNNVGFISTIGDCESNYINDPDNGLNCCFEDNLNKGQCLCNGMTIDDTSNPGTCCMENQEHPDNCLCSGTDMDDPTNPGNCCFANSGQCLCKGNYTDVPSKRCFNLDWKGDGICDDQNNHGGCNFDGGDCCGDNVDTDLCTQCQCLEEEAPLPNAVGCCYKNQTHPQECLCTGTEIDDPKTPGSCCMDDVDNPGICFECDGYKVEHHPDQCLCTGTNIDDPNTPGSCCLDDVDNPGNCFQCDDSTTCNSKGTCIGNTGKCECNGGLTGDGCDVATCPGKPMCGGIGTCPVGSVVCDCGDASYVNAECSPAIESGQFLMVTCGSESTSGKLTEVIDVLDSSKTCTTSIPDFPIYQKYMPLGGYLNGDLWICGGYQIPSGSHGFPYSKECYKADCSSLPCTWSQDATLGSGRAQSGAVVIKGTDPANDKLWLIGGHGQLGNSEFLHADGTVSAGPNPISADSGYCAVQLINSDGTFGNVLYMGGNKFPNRKKVNLYDISTDTITEDHSTMLFAHSLFSCTIFYSPKHEGRPVVFVGPGEGSNDHAELLDYSMTTTWEALPVMNYPNHHSQFANRAVPTPTKDGVYHINYSMIYELACTSSACSWTTVPSLNNFNNFTTVMRSHWFQAIYIPENLVSCN